MDGNCPADVDLNPVAPPEPGAIPAVVSARRPLRVEVVVPFGIEGGAELLLLKLLEPARPRLDVSFVALQEGALVGALRARGWPVSVRDTGRAVPELLSTATWLARRWRRAPELDVVLANGVKAAAVAVPAARMAGVRSVWFKHDFSFDRLLARLLALGADGVLSCSPEVAAATGRTDAVIIPPPTPDDPLGRAEARARLEQAGVAPGEGPLAACVGRLVSYKGVEDVISALAATATSWRLAVIGAPDPSEPGERNRLEALARAAGVEERVHFTGAVPDAGRLLSGVDAVVVPTVRSGDGVFGGEGFSLVAAEAMAAGAPVVLSSEVAASSRIEGAGITVDAGSPADIAAALDALASDGQGAIMGAAGRRAAAARPDVGRSAAELTSALAAVARRAGAGLAGEFPVSTVTTVKDEERALPGLLDALTAQMEDHDELIVVDGGSRDATLAVARARAAKDVRIEVIEVPGAGISEGRNLGIAAARHDVIACTDAGCAPVPGWLESLRAGFSEQPRLALVTGVYRARATTPWQRAAAAAWYPSISAARRPGPLAALHGRLFGRIFDPTMPTGRSMSFTKEAWAAAGGFPEHLATGEDVLFGRSIAAAGLRCVLAADAEVEWEQRPTLMASVRMFRSYGVGGGLSGERRLVARDLARAAAYPIGALLLARGGRWERALVTAAVGFYAAVPAVEVRRTSARAVPLVPIALAVKDVAKAVGCIAGLRARRAARKGTP